MVLVGVPVCYLRHGLVAHPTERKGSSCLSGEGDLDFQDEVVRVPESIGHAPDDLDTVVHSLQDAGVYLVLK